MTAAITSILRQPELQYIIAASTKISSSNLVKSFQRSFFASSFSKMSENFIICGGGIVGICTAYYLANHPKFPSNGKVVIVEADRIASAASGKAGGFLALDWHSPPTSSLASLSFSLHSSLSSQFSGPTSWNYRTLDTYSISYNPIAPSKSKNPFKAAKEKVPYLDSSMIGSLRSLGTKKTTAQVTPGKFCESILEEVKKGGKVQVMEGWEVVELEFEENKSGEKVPKTATIYPSLSSISSSPSTLPPNEIISIPITALILTAGPWTGHLAQKLFGEESKVYKKLSSVTGERANSVVVKKEEMADEKNASALFMSLKMNDGAWEPEVYPRNDGTVYICGPTPTGRLSKRIPLPPRSSLISPNQEDIDHLYSQAKIIFGEEVEKLAGNTCYLPVGNGPLVGKVGEKVWTGTGLSCWGITLGPGTGKVLSEMILEGEAKSADVSMLEP